MMRIIHAIINTRLNAVIIRNCITKCALKWHVDRFGTSLMKAARENAQIKHYLRALEKRVKQHLNACAKFNTLSNHIKSSLFCSAQGKALKKRIYCALVLPGLCHVIK